MSMQHLFSDALAGFGHKSVRTFINLGVAFMDNLLDVCRCQFMDGS